MPLSKVSDLISCLKDAQQQQQQITSIITQGKIVTATSLDQLRGEPLNKLPH